MSKSIVGIANSTSQVEATLADLQNDGLVASSDISLLMPDSGPNAGDTPELGAVKATKAPEGATTGAVSGGAIGGTVGLLAGIGALAIPGTRIGQLMRSTLLVLLAALTFAQEVLAQGEAALAQLKERGLYDSLHEALATARYGIYPEPQQLASWQAENPAQQIRAHFTPEGVQVQAQPGNGAPRRIGMKLRSVGYGEATDRG
jgi:hypothetical protein